ncbi:T9SS type A sorting domain-containing protein [Elusimicrobiota bacterium]
MKFFHSTYILPVAAICLFCGTARAEWTVQTLGTGILLGAGQDLKTSAEKQNPVSMTLDSGGNPHLCYTDGTTDADSNSVRWGKLIYKKWNGSDWDTETVVSSNSKSCSIALDSNDKPHIAYGWTTSLPSITPSLNYAKKPGASWEVEVVTATVAEEAKQTSIAIRSDNNPAIAFHDSQCSENALKFTRWNGSEWTGIDGTTNTVIVREKWVESGGTALPGAEGLTLKLDSSNNPHILFSALGGTYYSLHYTSWNVTQSTWSASMIAGASSVLNGYMLPDLILIDDVPHALYNETNTTVHSTSMVYTYHDGLSWQKEVLGDVNPSFMAFNSIGNSSDTIYATYIYKDHGKVYFAKREDSSTWKFTQVTDTPWMGFIDMAVDTTTAHILFTSYSGSNDVGESSRIYDLKYVRASLSEVRYLKTFDISASTTVTVNPTAGGSIQVLIPANTFSSPVASIMVSELTSVSAPSQSDLTASSIGVEIKMHEGTSNFNEVDTSGWTLPQQVTITITYTDSDISGLDESSLTLAYYNTTSGRWVPIPSTVYASQNKIVGVTTHLSKLAVFQYTPSQSLSADNFFVYPNPYKPNTSGSYDDPMLGKGIIFSGLTSNMNIRIFNIAGELVFETDLSNSSGTYLWPTKNNDGQEVASGVYIYLVTDRNSSINLKGRFAIIRK